MDDSEAKYLIDQFNKFSSWFLKGYDPAYSLGALATAIFATLIVIVNNLKEPPLSLGFDRLLYIVIMVSLLAVFLMIFRFNRKMTQEHENNLKN